MAINIKKNQVRVDFGSYRHYWRGVKKIGKTTLFADIVKAHYGSLDFGFIFSFGNETGYKALDGVFASDIPNWTTFDEYVTDFVKNRGDYKFKTLAFDTVDELVAIASEEALKQHKATSGKSAKSLNEAFGGYGAGHDYVKKIINNQISRLEGAGYGIVFISHTKMKTIKEKALAEEYTVLTGNLDPRFDNIFADKADIIAVIVAEKTTNRNGLLDETKRFIHFRDDGFIDAGTRLKEMPDKIEMSAESYLKAFEKGVLGSMDNPVSSEEMVSRKKNEVENRELDAENYVDTPADDVEFDDLKKEVVTLIKDKMLIDKPATKAAVMKFEPTANWNKIKDAETMKLLKIELEKIK